jgi:release factor glutamine methyltransferase
MPSAADFDVVISNPPYIAPEEAKELAPEVLDFDPHQALFAGGEGLDAYRAILLHLDRWLKPGGWLILEVGHTQAEKVARLVTGAGLDVTDIRRDLGGVLRAVVAQKRLLTVVN